MEKCKDYNENIDISNAILTFDTLYTNNHMKILKLLLPYIDTNYQKMLAIYIKWQEFIFTMNFFKQYSISLYSSDFTNHKKMDLNKLLPLLTPYCNTKEKDFLIHFQQIQNIIQMMENMQEYMPIFQQLMSASSDNNFLNFDIGMMDGETFLNTIKNMMSEEQQTMFQMFMEK